MDALTKEAKTATRQILLSFISDPYCKANETYRATRHALGVLSDARCSVAILTKGGTRSLADIDILKRWPDGRVKVGATLTFISAERAKEIEPGAATPQDRIDALRQIHEAGIKTWASIEPVIDPVESLAVIRASLPFVDAYKVGKLNHKANTTDWKEFCIEAVYAIRKAGKGLYVKDDLRAFAPDGFLRPEECTPETVFLPDRKQTGELCLI